MPCPSDFLERNFKELTAIYRTGNQEKSDWDDYNQLCRALHRGDIKLAQQLITSGAKLNKDPFIFPCYTPLHLAVIKGCPETVQMLIDRGASISRKELNGDTPLIMAAKMGRNSIVDILLSANGTLNTWSEENLSHMHIACMRNRVDIVKNMIQRGAHVNHCVSSKSLYWPEFTPLHFAVSNQNKETVQLLLDNGANILMKDARRLTPLHLAHMVRNEPIIDLILTAHKNEYANPSGPGGLTHFDIACTRNDTSVVQHFIEMDNYDVDKMVHSPRNLRGMGPIDFALYYQCFDVFTLLLTHGARITCASDCNLMDCVIMQENKTVFNAVLQHLREENRKKKPIEDLSDFHKACYVRDLEKIENFLSTNDEMIFINTFLSDRIPCTPLHLALRRRDEFQAKLLLRYGADITIQDANGDTPLQFAFEYGMFDIAKEMVNTALNPDIDPINNRGLSHFHIACACYEEKLDPNRNLISDFIRNGADINGQTSSNHKLWPKYTPLHFAVKFQQLKNIQTLLKHKADTKIKNKFNYNPVELNIMGFNLIEIDRKFNLIEKDNRKSITRFEILYNMLSYQIHAGFDSSENKGFTLLHALCIFQEQNVLEEYLVSNPDDINKTVEWSESRWYGFSPLHLAITYEQKENTAILMKYGADPRLKTRKSGAPLYHEFEEFPPSFHVNYGTIEPWSGLNHFHIICAMSDLKAVENFLMSINDSNERAAIVNVRDNQGNTPLHKLMKFEIDAKIHIIQLLFKNGADPNARNNSMRTPLHLAMGKINYQLIDLLISHGADVDARDLLNRTPLHLVFAEGRYRSLRFIKMNAEHLLTHGADINLTDCQDKTPFSYIFNEDSSYSQDYRGVFMLEHVTKLQIVGMYISQKVQDVYSAVLGLNLHRHTFDKTTFTKDCLDETEILKSTRINPNTTLRDILLKNCDQMANLCKTSILEDLVSSADFMKKIPLYGNLVKSQIKKGIIRRSLLQTGEPLLDKLFKVSLPQLCTKLISHYLSNQDLKNVIDSFNGM